MRHYFRLETVGYLAGVLGVLAVALALAHLYPDVRPLTAANSLPIAVPLAALPFFTFPLQPALQKPWQTSDNRSPATHKELSK